MSHSSLRLPDTSLLIPRTASSSNESSRGMSARVNDQKLERLSRNINPSPSYSVETYSVAIPILSTLLESPSPRKSIRCSASRVIFACQPSTLTMFYETPPAPPSPVATLRTLPDGSLLQLPGSGGKSSSMPSPTNVQPWLVCHRGCPLWLLAISIVSKPTRPVLRCEPAVLLFFDRVSFN